MELVFFLYGLAFVMLGVTILAQERRDSAYPIARFIWLLAGFGLVHGLQEWLELWEVLKGANDILKAGQVLALFSSYLFLFEFGRRLMKVSVGGGQQGEWVNRLLGVSLYPVLAGALLTAGYLTDQSWTGLAVWSKYLIGFPGALLTGIGFVLYLRAERQIISGYSIAGYFRLAAFAFIAYSLLSGLIGPVGDFPPANVLNEQTFRAAVGVPVAVFRGICALLAAAALWKVVTLFDLETRARLRVALSDSEQLRSRVFSQDRRHEVVLNSMGEAVCWLDVDGQITFANRSAARSLGYGLAELLGVAWYHLFPAEKSHRADAWENHPVLRTCKRGVPHRSSREALRRKDGSVFPVEVSSVPLREAGKVVGAVITFRDITERVQAERIQRVAEGIINTAPAGIIVTDARYRIVSTNAAFQRATGYEAQELLGRTPALLRSGRQADEFYERLMEQVRSTGRWEGEVWNRRKGGDSYPTWLNLVSIANGRGEITNYIGIYSDVSTQEQVQQRLFHLAYYDALTGLPNRQLLNDHLNLALARARRGKTMVAVMFLDLDRFKSINDTLGHAVGDQVLTAVAAGLRDCVREGDTVARLGGDEFLAVLSDIGAADDAVTVAEKILRRFRSPIRIDTQEIFVTSSIGISIYPDDGQDREVLIKYADSAMYRAKELGRNNFQIYMPKGG